MALPPDLPRSGKSLPWTRWPRLNTAAIAFEILLVALLGCWLGLVVGGRSDVQVGPVQTQFSVAPSTSGDSVVSVPPLGRLSVDSHDGPLRLNVEVTRLDVSEARRIFNNPLSVNGLAERVTEDMAAGTRRVAIQAAGAGTLGALFLGLLVFRRHPRRVVAATAISLVLLLSGGAAAAATWRPDSINEPKYEGLLASAPTVVGDAKSIVSDFREYERQLAKIVTNVSRLYDVTSSLPAYTADPTAIRVLFVSDIHLNPAAWEIIRSITSQFDINIIVDTGDISDHGSIPENQFVEGIERLGVPYVYVRGNHDSLATQRAVAAQSNAIVLDNSSVELEGLRIVGIGDPRFTPDKEIRPEDPPLPSIAETGQRLADLARREPPDIAMAHDADMAKELDGLVPLFLAGHFHRREQHELPAGTLLFQQGSTGASGLRGLEKERPTPVRCSVLYFSRESKTLQAWDDITLGGLGLTSAKIERHVYDKPAEVEDGDKSPRPTATPTASTTTSPTAGPIASTATASPSG